MTTEEPRTVARTPYPWPDAKWLELADLIRRATWEELNERERFTAPADLFSSVRRRAFGFLSSLARQDTAKAAWLDGNVTYMVAAAARELSSVGEIERSVFAFVMNLCDYSDCGRCGDGRPEFYTRGCLKAGLVSMVAPASRARFVAPQEWGWFAEKPVPSEWAARPLAEVTIVTEGDTRREPASLAASLPPFAAVIPDEYDAPFLPGPRVLRRLAQQPLAADVERSNVQRFEAYRDEVLIRRPGYWGTTVPHLLAT